MSDHNYDLTRLKLLGSAKLTISSAATSNFDFGTPNDLDLANLADFDHGDRILAVFGSTTAGTTDTVSFSVQDADDSSGSIGTPATAVTAAVEGTLAGGTGDQTVVVGVKLQYRRPWLRFRAASDGATDTHVVTCRVFAVPSEL